MMNTEALFWQALEAGDREVILPYSDWLEENGRGDEAEALRFMRRKDYWPVFTKTGGEVVICWANNPNSHSLRNYRLYLQNYQVVIPEALLWKMATSDRWSDIEYNWWGNIFTSIPLAVKEFIRTFTTLARSAATPPPASAAPAGSVPPVPSPVPGGR
jgi:uncharacterized protein (TIGR02996 family)